MNPFEDIDTTTLLSGHSDWLDESCWSALAAHPLECIDQEYPHYVAHVESETGPPRPSAQHPLFYGCYDWHSAVHSHWSLLRQLRLCPSHPDRDAIIDTLESRFSAEHVEAEAAYLEDNPSFERPYGWSWLLRLIAELHLWDTPRGREWQTLFAPLERQVLELVTTEFLPISRPFRVGTHHNSAYALAGVLDYARVVGDDKLIESTSETAKRLFETDRDYPVAYEPLGWDFISPALVEADLMRRVLPPAAFREWADSFFPDLTTAPADQLLEPVAVDTDSDEGLELHFVGLNLSKAWCFAGIAPALSGHRLESAFQRSAQRHAEAGMSTAFTDDYAGAHWLSSFVLYLLTRNDGGIAPS